MSEKKNVPCCRQQCDEREQKCGEEKGDIDICPDRIPGRQEGHRRAKSSKCMIDYESLDCDNKLIMNLRDLGHMLRFLFEGKGSQKRILIILNEAGTITQRELTERIGIQPGSASEVIGKLEDAGLIARTPSRNDRRTTNIQLTETGKIQAEEAARQRKARHQEMFSGLSEEEKQMLLTLLEKLNVDWNTRYGKEHKDYGHSEKREGHGHHAHPHHREFHH